MDAFYLDNTGSLNFGTDPGFQGSGSSEIGPLLDGTYGYPTAAQPVNDPSNTAGYSSSTPSWVGDVLTQGVGVLGKYLNNSQMLDYQRYEATNGGLYRQGNPALFSRNSNTGMNSSLLLALLVGGAFLLLRK